MNIFNIISFYESIVYEFRKNINNNNELDLLNDQVKYSYELAKIIKELAIKARLSTKYDNMDKYLIFENNEYKLNNYGITLAIACALFHNIGYYNQIVLYHKIDDNIKDNQELGVNYLMETKILRFLGIEDQIVIIEAVHNHNKDCNSYVDNCSKFYVNLLKEAKIIHKSSNKLLK